MSLVGAKVLRKEDPSLLTGHGRFVDDIAPVNTAFAQFVMSDQAHAKILSIDVSATLKMPGVLGVWTAADFATFPNLPGGLPDLERPVLAHDRVRWAGEPVAIVVAENRYQAAVHLAFGKQRIDDRAAVVDNDHVSNLGLARSAIDFNNTGIRARWIGEVWALVEQAFLECSCLKFGWKAKWLEAGGCNVGPANFLAWRAANVERVVFYFNVALGCLEQVGCNLLGANHQSF